MAMNQYRLRPLEDIKTADIITIPEASVLTCIGINTLYDMVKDIDADHLIHVGANRRRLLIDRVRFLSYLHRKG